MLALGLKYQIYKNQRRTKQPRLTALFVPAAWNWIPTCPQVDCLHTYPYGVPTDKIL